MEKSIDEVVYEFASELKKIIGTSLNQIILFGSYARGDNEINSDVDVMILVTLTDEEIKRIRNVVSDCAFEFLMMYGVDISPVIKNSSHFEYWVDALPFYKNVRDEGVVLSA